MTIWSRVQQYPTNGNIDIFRRPVLYIDSTSQQLFQVTEKTPDTKGFLISTSKNGVGEKHGSFMTPRGFHAIAQKIGDGEPLGRVFKSRQPQPFVCLPDQYQGDEDMITTRILWLEGLEPGFNLGSGVDTFNRYIYIHGTADEQNIGSNASIGCIRMKNTDIVNLFNNVETGDLVLIE